MHVVRQAVRSVQSRSCASCRDEMQVHVPLNDVPTLLVLSPYLAGIVNS